MNWWQHWKAKHWDEQPIPKTARPSQIFGDFPPLRRCGQWVAKHWREQPIPFLGVVAGLLVALATFMQGIAAIIQSLRC